MLTVLQHHDIRMEVRKARTLIIVQHFHLLTTTKTTKTLATAKISRVSIPVTNVIG